MKKIFFICSIFFILFFFVNCPQKQKQINVIYMAQAGYQPEEMQKMAEDFEKQSGIKVNISFFKYDEQHKEIVKSAMSKEAIYDVFSLDLIWTAEFAEKGYCIDMTDKVSTVADDIAPAIVDAFRYQNKIWAMPFLANFQLFFYNEDYIKKAGFNNPPATLEEMVEQMKVMKKKGIVNYPWADSWNQKEGLVCEYVWLTGAFGGDTFDENGKPIFNEGPGLKALEFMLMLLKEGLANPISLTSDEPMAKDIFISGQSAFNSNWTFQYALMNNPEVSKVVGKAKMGLLPVSKEILGKYPDNTASVSGFQGLAISFNSKNKDASWEYIKYITSKEVQKAHLEEMPVWTSVQNDPEVLQKDEVMSIKSKQIASVHHRPKVAKYTEVSAIMQKYIHMVLDGQISSPKEALDKAVEEINNL